MRELTIQDLTLVHGGMEQVSLPTVSVTPKPKSEFVKNAELTGTLIGSTAGEFAGFFTGAALGALVSGGNPIGIGAGAGTGAFFGSSYGGDLGGLVFGKSAEILESRDGSNYDGTGY